MYLIEINDIWKELFVFFIIIENSSLLEEQCKGKKMCSCLNLETG